MMEQAASRNSRRRGSSPSQPLLLLLFWLMSLAATARATLRWSVLSAGTPQAALEVEFEGVVGPEEETLHADARSIVSRSGALSLSVEAEAATGAAVGGAGAGTGGGGLFGGRREGQGSGGAAAADRRVTPAHLTARPGSQGGSALLAPEQPGDVAVVELLGGVGPQQQQDGGGAVVVVRGAASVLARTSGVLPGPVSEEDRALLRAFAGSSSSSGSAVGATTTAAAAAASLVRYHGRGRLALTAFGSIHRVTLRPGETRVVKGGHLLAWTEPARVRPESSSSSSSSPTSITVTGPGTAFLRSHLPGAYRRWAVPALPQLQAAVADAAAKATSAAAATAGGKRRPEEAEKNGAELPVMLRREGLGKRLRRRVWRLVAACFSALLLVAGVQVAQTLLMHGPEGLKDVPQNLLLLLEGLRRALLKAWAALVELYRSDLWSRLKTVLSPSSAPMAGTTTSAAGGGGFFMGSSSGGCATRQPEAEERVVGAVPPLFRGSEEGWEEE